MNIGHKKASDLQELTEELCSEISLLAKSGADPEQLIEALAHAAAAVNFATADETGPHNDRAFALFVATVSGHLWQFHGAAKLKLSCFNRKKDRDAFGMSDKLTQIPLVKEGRCLQ